MSTARTSGRRAARLERAPRASIEAEQIFDTEHDVEYFTYSADGEYAVDPADTVQVAAPERSGPRPGAEHRSVAPTADAEHVPPWSTQEVDEAEVVRGDGRRVGLVTSDSALRELVAGVCASAGASLRVAPVDSALTEVDIQLCDIRALATGHGPHDAAGREVVLLGRAEDTGLWDAAALLGGCPVAVLPEAESWLADRLAPRSSEETGESAVVVGVAGAVGGVGTSTIACWLAADAAATGAECALVDADPDGCGVDVLLGLESLEALRWPDLCRSRGVLRPEQLWPLLPEHVDYPTLRWLSWGRESVEHDQAPGVAVLAALRGAAHAVVVDLGRMHGGDTARSAMAAQCDVVLVALPRTVHGVLAAHRATTHLDPTPVELVLCGVDVADVDDTLVADALGRHPLAHVRFDGRVPEAAETGRLLEHGTKRSHAAAITRMWDELLCFPTPVAAGSRGGGF